MSDVRAIVIGGGPAGLQAALTLARMHVPALVLDSGVYRNAASPALHNLLGWDGEAPDDLRSRGRAEVTRLGGVVLDTRATAAARSGDGIRVSSEHGEWTVPAVILATGVVDRHPSVPGLEELWGTRVHPCPYCHAHEFAGRRIGIVADGSRSEHLEALLGAVASETVTIAADRARRIDPTEDGVRIATDDGAEEVAAVFVASAPRASTGFAESLGLDHHDGSVLVDDLQRTSAPGVWAAGDVAHRRDPRIPASVAAAIAGGLVAGADCTATLGGHDRTRG